MGSVRAGALDGSLRPRIVGLAENLPGPSWFVLVVDTGQVWIGDEDQPIAGPVLVWRPWKRNARAKFAAGATGHYAILGPNALASALGYMPETRELRVMEDKLITAPLFEQRERLQSMRFAFTGLNRELRSGGMAARAAVEAYLRVILIEVYRAGQSQMAGSDKAPSSNREFTKFIELVEAHFRERWTVNEYAGSLGMSRDRLGDICHRVRGLGPKDLIDRRVTVEARLQLENSSNSIQEIAALLGFSSSPQFTRFFVRTMGTPPGLYRKECASGVLPDEMEPVLPFEWP